MKNLNLPEAIAAHRDYSVSLAGTKWPTKHYGELRIIAYNSTHNVEVQFIETGFKKITSLAYIQQGIVKDNSRGGRIERIFGVGCPGIGKYSKTSHRVLYNKWCAMLSRCYSPKALEREPAYKDCKVCEEWHNFQNFAKWCEQQPHSEEYHLDKDVLHKNCKLYSPDNCLLLPGEINRIFAKRASKRGNCPIGVCYNKTCTKHPFQASCGNQFGFKEKLGCFASTDEAFAAYKMAKERVIKYAANLYKDKISKKAYNALMNYQVEITD